MKFSSNDKKRILFNCSTNVVGGAIQNAYNFILNALSDNDFNWLILVSPQINKQLKKVNIEDERIILIQKSPSKNLKIRKTILKHEEEFNPDLVYTMAGPSYVKFKKIHAMGLSNAYLTHANIRAFFFGRNLTEAIQTLLTVFYQGFHANNANFFIFQTTTSRDSFCKRFQINKLKTKIIPNAIGNIFNNSEIAPTRNDNEFIIFCPAADYPHKSLHIIPKIAKHLYHFQLNKSFKFVLTLSQNSKLWEKILQRAKKYNIAHLIENIGPFDYIAAPKLHAKADIIFIPSILETFSTSYLEGLESKKPLLVSNLPFATEICGASAIYFKPFSVNDAANQLKEIILRYKYYSNQSKKEASLLDKFGNQKERYLLIKKHLLYIVNQKK